MKKVQVIQLGNRNLSETLDICETVEWIYEPDFSERQFKGIDVFILGRDICFEEFEHILELSRAYCIFITSDVETAESKYLPELIQRKLGKILDDTELADLLRNKLCDYFSGSYGEKYQPDNITVSDSFKGTKFWNGFDSVDLEGDFGLELKQIVFWRNMIPIEKGQYIEFWLEYIKDDSVEIALEMIEFYRGSVSKIKNQWYFDENSLNEIIYIGDEDSDGNIFVSLKARGQGKFSIVGLHDRYSRRGAGLFLPGGQRRITSDREEVFYYFDPGDLKPPLNVYFSGYKTREGFEGYNMMRSFGKPFLLIAEARLEGGGFYLGTDEFEDLIEDIIKEHLDKLGFSNKELILSGLSMGTFGALYYACKLRPNTVILGKPLASLGDMASNERIHRPGGFPTSLDVLHKAVGSMNLNSRDVLNKRFWDRFDSTVWSGTSFIVAYMIDDDYDATGYDSLIYHLRDADTRIYGKGLHGRHNDNTHGIVSWFVNRYISVINNEFKEDK